MEAVDRTEPEEAGPFRIWPWDTRIRLSLADVLSRDGDHVAQDPITGSRHEGPADLLSVPRPR